jgi:archaellum component FlaC
MADDAKQLQEDLKELERLASKLGKSVNFSNLKNDAEAVKELLKAWRKEVDEISNEFKDLSSTFKNVLDDLRNFNSTSSSVNRRFKTLGWFADKLK